MESISGEIVLTPEFIQLRFEGIVNFCEYPEINAVFVTIKDPATEDLGYVAQILERDGPNSAWKLRVGVREGDSYAVALRRLLLAWDRVMQSSPEDIRQAYEASREVFHGFPVLPYRESVDVDE